MSNLQLLDRRPPHPQNVLLNRPGARSSMFLTAFLALSTTTMRRSSMQLLVRIVGVEIWGSLSICSWQSSKEGAFRNLLCQRRLPNSYSVYLRFTRKLWAHLATRNTTNSWVLRKMIPSISRQWSHRTMLEVCFFSSRSSPFQEFSRCVWEWYVPILG